MVIFNFLEQRQLSQNEIKKTSARYKIVALAGLYRAPSKDSHRGSAYLKYHGFHIIPVNPFADEILGEKSYKKPSPHPAYHSENHRDIGYF